MNTIVRIPHDHAILVCSSHKALILVNRGAVAQPDLKVERHFEVDMDDADMTPADRPGRRFDGGAAAMTTGQKSAMEAPDPARKVAEGFADEIVDYLVHRQETDPFGGILLVAPPTFLGLLRARMDDGLAAVIVGEVSKDLADMPVPRIRDVLMDTLGA